MSRLVKLFAPPTQYFQADMALIETAEISSDAKILYMYAASRPPNWEIFSAEIQKRWGWSAWRVSKATKELKKKGLLKITQERDAQKKRFTNRVWHLLGLDVLKPAGHKKESRISKIPVSDMPNPGKMPPNYNQKNLKPKKKQPTAVVAFDKKELKKTETSSVQSEEKEKHALEQLLIAQGMIPPVAKILVSEFSGDVIRNQVAWLPYRKYDEAGAFLKSAIQKNYAPPREVKSQMEAAEKAEQREKEKQLQNQAREQFEVGQKLKTPSGKIAQIRLIMSNALDCICEGISASIPFEKALTWEPV